MSSRRPPPARGSGDSPSSRSPEHKRSRTGAGPRAGTAGASAGGPPASSGGAPSHSSEEDPTFGTSTLKEYKVVDVSIVVADLVKPENAVRPLRSDPDAVEKFIKPFEKGNYGDGGNYISVAVSPESNVTNEDLLANIERQKNPADPLELPRLPGPLGSGVKVMLVDGAHRVAALLSDELKTRIPEVQARLYTRQDGKRMTYMDFVTVGNRLNDCDTLQNRTSHFERVYSCASTLRNILGMSEGEVADITNDTHREDATNLRRTPNALNLRHVILHRSLFSFSTTRPQTQKYCTIAFGLYKHPGLKDEVQSAMESTPGVVFVGTQSLWELPTFDQVRATLQCHAIYIGHSKQAKKKAKGMTPAVFIQKINDAWKQFERQFEGRGVDPSAAWKLHCVLPDEEPNSPKSVAEKFAMILDDDLRAENLETGDMWTKTLVDVIARIEVYVKWPPYARGLRNKHEASPPRTKRVQSSNSSGSSEESGGSRDDSSEQPDDRRGDSPEASDDRRGDAISPREMMDISPTGRGTNSPLPGQIPSDLEAAVRNDGTMGDSPASPSPPIPRSDEEEGGNDDADLDSDPEEGGGKAGKGRSDRREERSSAQPWGAGDASDDEEDNEEDNDGEDSPVRRRRSRREAGSSAAHAARGQVGKKGPPPTPTRHSSRLASTRKTAVVDESESESADTKARKKSEERRARQERRKREQRAATLRSKDRKGLYRHIRIPGDKRTEAGSDDSSDCESDLETAAVPEWRMEKHYCPPHLRQEDEHGFSVRHSWGKGLFYNRPKPRKGIFEDPKLADYHEDNPPLKRSGAYKEGWKGTLPGGGGEDWLYPDRYQRLVQHLPRPWKLCKKLPESDAPEWTLKYKFPLAAPTQEEYKFNQEALLRSLGFRPPHQTHFRLTTEDILNVRWSAFRHLTKELRLDNVPTESWGPICKSFFQQKREMLDVRGYTVFEGFVTRESIDNGPRATEWSRKANKDIKALFTFFASKIPVAGANLDKHDEDLWDKIRNKKTAAKKGDTKNARWQSTPWATNTFLEDPKRSHLLRARCLVEVANWTLMHLMHCGAAKYGDVDVVKKALEEYLSATDSGSRVLGTSAKCDRQRAHKDFKFVLDEMLRKYGTVAEFPGYFSIAMGPDGGELWIVPFSHYYLVLSKEAVDGLAEHLPMIKVSIPPYGLFVARGDYVHAGIAGEDGNDSTSTRLHDYYVSKKSGFFDNIDDIYKFLAQQ